MSTIKYVVVTEKGHAFCADYDSVLDFVDKTGSKNIYVGNYSPLNDSTISNILSTQDTKLSAERETTKLLKRRLRHLLESKVISLYDEVNPHTKEYKHDIKTLDKYLDNYSDLLIQTVDLKLLTGFSLEEIVNLVKKGHVISFKNLNPKGMF